MRLGGKKQTSHTDDFVLRKKEAKFRKGGGQNHKGVIDGVIVTGKRLDCASKRRSEDWASNLAKQEGVRKKQSAPQEEGFESKRGKPWLVIKKPFKLGKNLLEIKHDQNIARNMKGGEVSKTRWFPGRVGG